MMEKELKAPKLRFPGFTDDWEQRKLVNCFKERTERCAEGELIAVTINSGVVKASDLNRNNNSSEDKSHYKVVKKNDIAYNTMRMWQGASGYSKYDGILSPAYTVAIPNSEIDSVFFSYMFKRNDLIHEFKINSQGLTSDTWNLKFQMFSNIKVNVPIYEEQKKIGLFFSEIDNHITLHQRKLDTLKKLKKGFLQKMFPKNGESVPEIRFPGFTDAWEQRKFGDVFNEYSEKKHPELPALTIIQGTGTILRDESDRKLQYDKASLVNYKLVNKDDLIVHLRSFEGGLEKANSEGIVSPAYHIFHGENTDTRFYYPFFRSRRFIDVLLKPHVYGIRDGKSIDIEGMKTISIPVPSYEEQEKVGDFIEKLDNLITLHQRKLDTLKKFKQGMLQQMFI